MPIDVLADDAPALMMFDVVQANAPGTLDGTSRVIERVARPNCVYRYQVQDRALWRVKFESPIFSVATRSAGSILGSYVGNRFATEVCIDGEGGDLFCFTTLLRGRTTLVQNGDATTGTGTSGLVWRPGPGPRLLISDDSARASVFFRVAEIEDALERTLDDRLRKALEFKPNVDWSSGMGASLKGQLDFLMHDLQRPDGMASNPVALASMTDLLVSLVLRGASHNYAGLLDRSPGVAVPVYVRRAEDFMRANCMQPIRMAQVAAAAGCSVGTLGVVFKRFRGQTPLSALHAIRLEGAHCELTRSGTDTAVATVARRYGFTNSARFTAAFRRRFGEKPSEAVRRASRSSSPST